MFRVNKLTENIYRLLNGNKNERKKAQKLCSKHMERDSKILEERHLYF